jgi:hypothetical protein
MRAAARSVALDIADIRGAAVAILAAGAALPVLPGHPSLSCPLRSLTGVPCPLCGMSTAVEETVRLHLGAALRANPAGVLAVVVALVLLVLRPRRLALPQLLVPLVLVAMWLFELHRFSLL